MTACCMMCDPLHRSEDPLPSGSGAPEMHAGISRETEVLPGSL